MFDDDIVERDAGAVVVDWPVVVEEPDAPGVDELVVEEPVEDEPVMDGLESLAPDRSEAELPLVPIEEPPRCASAPPGDIGEAELGAEGEEEPAPELEPEPEPLVWARAGAASKVVASR